MRWRGITSARLAAICQKRLLQRFLLHLFVCLFVFCLFFVCLFASRGFFLTRMLKSFCKNLKFFMLFLRVYGIAQVCPLCASSIMGRHSFLEKVAGRYF